MKRALVLVLAAVGLGAPAMAQTPPAAPGATAAQPPAPPPLPPDSWLPKPGLELAGLDKITAKVTPLVGKIGQAMHFGSLTVTAESCIIRGPDQPADQAAFLDITDSRDASFAFHGWVILSDPAASLMQHPVYDLRLIGCRG
jgi:hypothetical protein